MAGPRPHQNGRDAPAGAWYSAAMGTTSKPSRAATTSTTRQVQPPTSPASIAASPTPPSHDEIAAYAYDLYVASGYQDGRDEDNWLRAEAVTRDGAGESRPRRNEAVVRLTEHPVGPEAARGFFAALMPRDSAVGFPRVVHRSGCHE